MNPGLLILTQIAIAGCAFLVYFFHALRRDLQKKAKVHIRPISTLITRGRVVQLYALDKGRDSKVAGVRTI